MTKFRIEGKIRFITSTMAEFFCPACNQEHMIDTEKWTYNGNPHSPTFQPSILVSAGHYLKEPHKPGNCYCDFHERFPNEEPMLATWRCYRCHSYVTNGEIQFLSDCSHEFKDRTMPLPDFPASLPDEEPTA